jgi:hypothetical protein
MRLSTPANSCWEEAFAEASLLSPLCAALPEGRSSCKALSGCGPAASRKATAGAAFPSSACPEDASGACLRSMLYIENRLVTCGANEGQILSTIDVVVFNWRLSECSRIKVQTSQQHQSLALHENKHSFCRTTRPIKSTLNQNELAHCTSSSFRITAYMQLMNGTRA